MSEHMALGIRCCMACSHFRNAPEYLESAFKGWSAMGSAHGSVRKDDGICLLNDVYLSARDWCKNFDPA